MPWVRIDYRTDAEWAEQLQQQIEEAERQDRLRTAFLASLHHAPKPQRMDDRRVQG